jgi:hypothetical protein
MGTQIYDGILKYKEVNKMEISPKITSTRFYSHLAIEEDSQDEGTFVAVMTVLEIKGRL